MARRQHKAFVMASDEDWLAFRAITVEQRTTIMDALGRMVEAVVHQSKREQSRNETLTGRKVKREDKARARSKRKSASPATVPAPARSRAPVTEKKHGKRPGIRRTDNT